MESFFLSFILCWSAFIHLWGIKHLFKWIADYDEGVYSLGGRFISEGYLPYKDFYLVHPPLYDLCLASIYRIFGYDFFFGRYFSIALSLLSVILVFLILKKLFNPAAGLAGAALFSVFPGLYYTWYRVVQEPLAIFFVLLAIFTVADFIKSGKTGYRLWLSGFFLGLALATKHTFIAPIVGIIISICWLSFKQLFTRPVQWQKIPMKIEAWLPGVGIISGYFLISGFFLITSPQEYIDQTIFTQIDYRLTGTWHTVISKFQRFPHAVLEDKVITICILVIFFILFIMLIRKDSSRSNTFLSITLLVSTLISSCFNQFGETRYFVPSFMILVLGTASLMPEMNMKTITSKLNWQTLKIYRNLFIVMLILVLSIFGFLFQRKDYYFMGPGKITFEENVYLQAIDYLEQFPGKIYALNPILPAFSPETASSLYFDTFGMLEVIKLSADEIIQKQIEAGVNLFVIDMNVRLMALNNMHYYSLIEEIITDFPMIQTFSSGELRIFDIDLFLVTQ